MLLPFLFAPVWLICVIVSLFLRLSHSERARWSRRLLSFCSTGAMLGSALGGAAGMLFVRLVCGSTDNYSCLHAGVFYGLVGSLGGVVLGFLVGGSLARKGMGPETI